MKSNRREFLKLAATSGLVSFAASPLVAADGAPTVMRTEPKAVQDAKRAKTFAAGKWMHDHGYSFIFMEDSIDA